MMKPVAISHKFHPRAPFFSRNVKINLPLYCTKFRECDRILIMSVEVLLIQLPFFEPAMKPRWEKVLVRVVDLFSVESTLGKTTWVKHFLMVLSSEVGILHRTCTKNGGKDTIEG